MLGASGTINMPSNSPIVLFAQSWFLPPWLAYVVSAALGGRHVHLGRPATPTTHPGRAHHSPLGWQAAKAGGLLLLCAAAVSYLATDRGVGVMFVFFIALVIVMDVVLTRTRWGREVYAVGGSVEAARRAGIRVEPRLHLGLRAVLDLRRRRRHPRGGAAQRRRASRRARGDTNLNAIAAAVIGGTSLFGGRGSAWSALLGIAVIQSISNGLTLLNLDSSIRYMITGVVLLLAVIIDSLSRKSRAAHGQA